MNEIIWLLVNLIMEKKLTSDSKKFLSVLNKRSQEIFKCLVEAYIETGAPVGSRHLSRIIEQSLSPATVRNVMMDLEELGLIAAPHISAGRQPTQSGLRFFVDAMLEAGTISDEERKNIAKQIEQSAKEEELEDLLAKASSLLSGLSKGAGLVIASKANMTIKHIEFVRLDKETIMAILVGEDGQVENRIFKIDSAISPATLEQASNYLNHHLSGHTLSQAKEILLEQQKQQKRELDELTNKLVEAGLATLSASASKTKPTLIVRGRANLINDTMAMEELARVRELFDELESKQGLIDLLDEADSAQGVRIFIGSENKLFSLSGSSVIIAPFKDSGDNVVGALGIIGPTRLNYARIVPVVDYTAHIISRIVAHRS